MRSAPENKLSKQAVKAWRITRAVKCILFSIGFLVIINLLGARVTGWIFIGFAIILVIVSAACIYIIPEIRIQRWRYQVDEFEVDLQKGLIIISRTLIPIKRVQHVRTRQGPVSRLFGIADVNISTAATTHRIPSLDLKTADILRDRISKLAQLAEDDV
jgi:membrane protein YdbS with pleckstrin-like domain